MTRHIAIYPALITPLIIWCASAHANEWQMSFPVTQEGRIISEVNLTTDGSKILYFTAGDVTRALADYLSEDATAWLNENTTVTPNQLSEYGIDLVLDSQTLTVEMKLQAENSALRTIGLDRYGDSNDPYTAAATWSWQNNFNLAHQYYDNSDNDETTIDWLGGANIGGVDGLNATYSLYLNSQDETEFYRGKTQMFYDNTTAPWRLSVGDIEPVTSGHLPGISLGGANFERAYSQIQPYRQLRNSGTQSLELTESAEVTVYVNDIRISRLRLSPGRYEIDDLPLTDGANDIRLDIQYASGRFETVTYSQFYNGRLLKEGLADFTLAIGVESTQLERDLEYDDSAIALGFYEYGISDALTVGVNGLTHQDGQIAGFSLVNGSDFGNITLRASTSHSTLNSDDEIGYATSLDYSQQIFGSSPFGSPNFRISADWQQNFNAQPWKENNEFSYTGIRADYQWYITDQWDANIYAAYRDEQSKSAQYDATVKLNWRNQYWRVGLVGEYHYPTTDTNNDEYKGYITVEFFYDLFSSKHRFNASYNSDLKESRVEVRKAMDNYVNDYGYELSAETRDGYKTYLARGEYSANRWRGQLEVENRQPQESNSHSNVYGSLSSSFIVADGKLAIGRASVGSNAIIDVHPTLSDSHVHVNSNFVQQPEAISTSALSNMVSLPRTHEINTMTYSVPDAPLGYSLGAGINSIKPGSLTTHIITVGSNATRTFIASAYQPDGTAVSLQAGTATDELGNQLPIFTNSAGRFVLDGVAAGQYQITLGKWVGKVLISDDSPILIYSDDLIMQSKEDFND